MFKSTENQQYYYRLRAENGRIILNGEGYTTKQSCISGIRSVQNNAPLEIRYEKKDAPDNYTFVLKAANGEIIGRSENYTTAFGRDNGIAAVKYEAPGAPTEDLS